MTTPLVSGIVVHWRAERELARLLAAWPGEDGRLELIVVDNGARAALDLAAVRGARLVAPGKNLGFAGGSNLGARAARGELLLFLNPDARPAAGALDALLAAAARDPGAAGFVPRLVGEDGAPQFRWQLRPLPKLRHLVAQCFFFARPRGPRVEPPAGATIAQPAAAALALRRAAFESAGGFDERFFPAWFEDVDLALRLAERGARLVYVPAAEFLHARGASVPELGYAQFLLFYARNLVRYGEKHHGRAAARALRAALAAGALLRLALLPLRAARRAASRGDAARALLALAGAAARGFPRAETAA